MILAALWCAGLLLAQLAMPSQLAACADYITMVAELEAKYGEVRRDVGRTSATTVLEVYVNQETRTWTIIQRNVSGIACVVAAGDSWQSEITAKPKGMAL